MIVNRVSVKTYFVTFPNTTHPDRLPPHAHKHTSLYNTHPHNSTYGLKHTQGTTYNTGIQTLMHLLSMMDLMAFRN